MFKSKFNILFEQIISELTKQDLDLIDSYTKQRKDGLSFGQIFKEQRTYFPITNNIQTNIEIPEQVDDYLNKNNFKVNDYKKGIATDKYGRLVKIGKVLAKATDKDLIKQFNERLTANVKTINTADLCFCITYNPEDIAKMSTERNWTSCMQIHTGAYKETPLLQIKFGGMCAYLINKSDKNIQNPYARIAIKRLENENDNTFIFVEESKIYGDWGLANSVNMFESIENILDKSNEITGQQSFRFKRNPDDSSYSDAKLYEKFNKRMLTNDLSRINGRNIFEILWSTKIPETQLRELINKFHLTNDRTHIFFNITNSQFYDNFMQYKSDFEDDEHLMNLSNYEQLSSEEAYYMLWYVIARKQQLSVQFILDFYDELNPNIISKYQSYKLVFDKRLQDYVNFNVVFSRENLPLKYFKLMNKENSVDVDWKGVIRNNNIPLKQILNKMPELNWYSLLYYRQIPENILIKYLDQIKNQDVINILLMKQHLSYEFLKTYIKEYKWPLIIVNDYLMKNVYLKHKDLFNQDNFNIYTIQKLIYDYGYDASVWCLPEEFLLEWFDLLKSHFNKILYYVLLKQNHCTEITKTVIQKYIGHIDWYTVFTDELKKSYDYKKLSDLIPGIYTKEFLDKVEQVCTSTAKTLLEEIRKKFKI